MQYIAETTEIDEDVRVWESIPLDETVSPSDDFINLFQKNSTVFDFIGETGRRTVIDLFLREVVSIFPPLMIVCEYHMKLQNDSKRRKLNGFCDYTVCHRGHRNLPHLVAIEAKKTVKEALLQCIGECASIHYRRKQVFYQHLMTLQDNKRHKAVYGIHSTGTSWYFIHVDENGGVYQSQEYKLSMSYVKEEVEMIYRLVYHVIYQSHLLSERTTPATSLMNL